MTVSRRLSVPKRDIYLVRHGDRLDFGNSNWQAMHHYREYASDNAPLSFVGRRRVLRLHNWFKKLGFTHVFSSPLDRCLETASAMIGKMQDVKIKIEGSFTETLYVMTPKPGIRPLEAVLADYPAIDEHYDAVIDAVDVKRIGYLFIDSVKRRVNSALLKLFAKYEGSIVIVAHDSTIQTIIKRLVGKLGIRVATASVTHLRQIRANKYKIMYKSRRF